MALNRIKNKATVEFGDFQTPRRLADEACSLLKTRGVHPLSIIEPTCGVGNFLLAATECWTPCKRTLGIDINPGYIDALYEKLRRIASQSKCELICADFFNVGWPELFAKLPEPILVIGNPPWVTNAHLGILGSDNLPVKSNFQKHTGFDAVTGKSNFDISEWMLIRLLECLQGKVATLAMLCKTAVARKVLCHAWKGGMGVDSPSLYLIDAAKHFDVAVDACFFVSHFAPGRTSSDCRVFESLQASEPSQVFGYRDRRIVADVNAYETWKHLEGAEHYRWRSGIKHDCANVMELGRVGDIFYNGLGRRVDIEADYLYPLLKGSDVAKGNVRSTNRFMLVPQSAIAEDTKIIQKKSPLTWAYLQTQGHLLDRRASSIYKNRPRFSVFGVGDYSFSMWKVAISGFYKSLKFRVIGPIEGKPAVLDDTSNFIPCASNEEAECMAELLNSRITAQFLEAFIFWDAKRPITVDLLRRLDILRLAEADGSLSRVRQFIPIKQASPYQSSQPALFP